MTASVLSYVIPPMVETFLRVAATRPADAGHLLAGMARCIQRHGAETSTLCDSYTHALRLIHVGTERASIALENADQFTHIHPGYAEACDVAGRELGLTCPV